MSSDREQSEEVWLDELIDGTVITELSPYTNYSIEVAAVNVHGQKGPFATTRMETLPELVATGNSHSPYLFNPLPTIVVCKSGLK